MIKSKCSRRSSKVIKFNVHRHTDTAIGDYYLYTPNFTCRGNLVYCHTVDWCVRRCAGSVSKTHMWVFLCWYRFLSLTFITSKAATSVIEELKSFKEGITVKLDFNPGPSLSFFSLFVVSLRECQCVLHMWNVKLMLIVLDNIQRWMLMLMLIS